MTNLVAGVASEGQEIKLVAVVFGAMLAQIRNRRSSHLAKPSNTNLPSHTILLRYCYYLSFIWILIYSPWKLHDASWAWSYWLLLLSENTWLIRRLCVPDKLELHAWIDMIIVGPVWYCLLQLWVGSLWNESYFHIRRRILGRAPTLDLVHTKVGQPKIYLP